MEDEDVDFDVDFDDNPYEEIIEDYLASGDEMSDLFRELGGYDG